jgi:hypothetical protein
MSFPIYSTDTETWRMARVLQVQARSKTSRWIKFCSVFACKETVGTDLYSPHSQGDAGDLMIKESFGRKAVADAIVWNGLHRTWANRFKRTEVYHVIYNDKQWVRGEGWSQYTGVPHNDHVHAACSGSLPIKPACVGGTYLPVKYKNKP